jgi:hypothetical protein
MIDNGPACLREAFASSAARACRSWPGPFDVSIEHQLKEKNIMRFAVLVHATKESEAGVLPSAELLEKMGRFNEELVKAGVMLAGEGLKDSSHGARLSFSGGKATVIDGPFAETKELIAGFWIVQAKSKEEVVERFSRAPMLDGDVIEIRQIFEAEDFGENFTPEEREREARLRSELS